MPLSEFTPAAQKVLNQALSGAASNHDRLQTWAEANMPDVGTSLVAGSIIWSKALGRSSTQKLCDGFAISLVVSTVETDQDSGLDTWVDSPAISVDRKWDDSDGDKYLVHFLHSMLHGNRLRVSVTFGDGVDWQNASGAPQLEQVLVSPTARAYGYKLSHPDIPNWIEPYRVIRLRDTGGAYRVP